MLTFVLTPFIGVFTLVTLLVVTNVSAAGPDENSPSLLTTFETEETTFSLSPTPPPSLGSYARTGWQATLSTLAHNVSGTVTILDADTFRVDNFFYNGGGINVHFILAAADDYNTFRNDRLVTDLNLLGTAHNGDSVTIDLPTGTTFDGFNAISVWCLPAAANFGSGNFVNPAPTPEPTGASLLVLGTLALGCSARLRPKHAVR